MFTRLYNLIAGSAEEYRFEHRIFNLSSFIITIFCLQGTLINYLLGLHIATVWLATAGCAISFLLFYLARIKKWFTTTTIFVYVLSTMAILGTMHFYNGGSSGTVIYLLIMLLNIFLLISNRRDQLRVYALLGGTVLILLLLESFNPQWVVPYRNADERMSDHVTVLIYSLFFTMIIIRLFRESYDKDRRIILEQKNELEMSYRQSKEKNEYIESLIRELHHRVKNNLQVVSSLMALQSSRVEDDKAREALEEGRSRVNAMAMIHQRLYMDNELATVNITEYLEHLSASLATSYGFDPGRVNTTINLGQASMDIDMAIPIGLIVNELITNAFKHAFVEITDPRINVLLNKKQDRVFELRVADNGVGMRTDNVRSASGSFGMKLVGTLVKQLNGKMEVVREKGTEIIIEIRA